MEPTLLFELVIVMFVANDALHYLANRLQLPPSVSLLAGGGALALRIDGMKRLAATRRGS